MRVISIFFIFIISTIIYAEDVVKTDSPTWELGIGAGMLSMPHYRGSDQRANYISPIPYIRYSGERLKIDREGSRFYFYDSEDVKVDVSLAFALQVDSDDNRARQGMTDIKNILEAGPRILFNLYQSTDKNLRFRLAIPLRAAYALDLSNSENIGWTFSPYLQLQYFSSGWGSTIAIGPSWASEKYNDYFYQVEPQYAVADRPDYNAQAGYSGSRITVSLSKRFDEIYFGMFARYDNLNGAVFVDSPLVKQKDSFMIGAALSWVFEKSEER